MNTDKQKTALIFTGMYSTKYGQVERYMLALAQKCIQVGYKPVLLYNHIPFSEAFIKDIETSNIELKVLNPDLNFFSLSKQVIKLIKQYKPEVVHTHFRGSIIRPVMFFSYIMKVSKRFNTFHCRIPQYKFVTELWMRLIHKCSTKMICVSDSIKNQQIEMMKAPKYKLVTLRMGIRDSHFKNITLSKKEIREKHNLPQDGIIICNVAFHHDEKGIDILLDAVKQVNDILDKKVYLCQVGQELAGDGGKIGTTYTNFLKEKAIALGLKDYVFWLGRQNNVPELLSAIDIYVHASRDEGLGLILLEAFLSKLPVVGSNVGGIPEVVNNDRGFLFEKEQSNELADKLLQLITSAELRAEKSTKGYKFVEEHYNLDTQIDKMIQYYLN